MHANPFDPSTAAPAATATTGRASNLPYTFMALTALIGLIGLLVNLASIWLLQGGQLFEQYLEYLPQILGSSLESALLSAVAALLLSRSYLERYAIAGFSRPRQLLAVYFGVALVLALAASFIGGQLLSHLLAWAYEQFESTLLPQLLISGPINLLLLALTTLLPLWLCLQWQRHNAVGGAPRVIERREPALAFALCFAVYYLKLLNLLPEQVFFYDDAGIYGLSLLGALLYTALIFAAARSALPLRLRQHNPGRLFLASLLCLLLWLLTLTLVAAVLLVCAMKGMEPAAWLILLGLGLLALLWPLTRLSLRWVYKPQAA